MTTTNEIPDLASRLIRSLNSQAYPHHVKGHAETLFMESLRVMDATGDQDPIADHRGSLEEALEGYRSWQSYLTPFGLRRPPVPLQVYEALGVGCSIADVIRAIEASLRAQLALSKFQASRGDREFQDEGWFRIIETDTEEVIAQIRSGSIGVREVLGSRDQYPGLAGRSALSKLDEVFGTVESFGLRRWLRSLPWEQLYDPENDEIPPKVRAIFAGFHKQKTLAEAYGRARHERDLWADMLITS